MCDRPGVGGWRGVLLLTLSLLVVTSAAADQVPVPDGAMIITFDGDAHANSDAVLVDGHEGRGLLVSAERGAAQTVDAASHATTEKGAIDFWFKPNWIGDDGEVRTIFADAGGSMRLIKSSTNQLDFRMYNAAGDMIIYGDFRIRDWPANEWRHIQIRWDLEDVTYVYLDGQRRQSLHAKRNWRPAAPLQTLHLGGDTEGGAPADGVFDSVAIWAGPPRPGEAAWRQVERDAVALIEAGGYAIDFGPGDKAQRPGFTRITNDMTTAGDAPFGWIRPVNDAKLSEPYHVPFGPVPPIERTFVEGAGDNAFHVDVSAGAYRVWLVTGDLRAVPPAFAVSANGQTVLSIADMSDIMQRIQFNTFDVQVGSSGLSLMFHGSPRFVANGCVIAPMDKLDAAEPVIAALRQDFEMTMPHFLERWDVAEYVETNDQPQTSAAHEARGFMHFIRPSMSAIYPGTIPANDEVGGTVRAAATPGEYEPMTVGIYPLRDVAGVDVTLSDLQGPGGARIGQDAMTLRLANYRAARTHWSMKTEYRTRPEVLFKVDGPVDLTEAKLFWIVLQVPDDAPAGTYRGTLSFAGPQGDALDVPLELEVLPFTLPRDSDRIFGMWYNDPTFVAAKGAYHGEIARERGTLARYYERRRRDFEDMREHGMQMINLPPMHVHRSGDEVMYDASHIIELVELGREMGLIRRPMFSGGPELGDIDPTLGSMVWGRTPLPTGQTWHDTSLYSDEIAEIYVNGIRYIQQLVRERGWPEIMIMPLDEPTSTVRGKAAEYLCDLVHRVPGMRTFITGQIRDDYLYPELMEKIDVACYTGLRSVPESPEEAAGDWIYPNNIAFTVGDGPLARFGTGFGFWFSGLEGWAPHRYTSIQESIDTDMDDRRSDCFFAYPMPNDYAPTIRWEQVREGVDDCRYMTLLRQLIERAEQSGNPDAQSAARDARAMIERLRAATPTMQQFAAGIAIGALGFEGEQQTEAFDREAWSRHHIPQMRRDVAAMIVRLQETM